MSTELVRRNDTFMPEIVEPTYKLAKTIANTDFVPKALRNKPEAVLACMLTGQEIGVGPMQALSKIHVIEGRPTMSAELMRSLALSIGHDIWFEEMSATRVTICGRRAGSDKVSTVTWTLDDAKRAGLSNKQNWRSYPRQMLVARASGDLCRLVFADCLGGISYSIEELEDGIDGPAGEPEGNGGPAPKPTHTRKRATRKTAEADPAPSTNPSEPVLPPLPGEDADIIDAEVISEDSPPSVPTGGDGEAAGGASGNSAPQEDSPRREFTLDQRLAAAADKAGIDEETRHALVSLLTKGRTESGKDVTEEEAATLFELYHLFAEGTISAAFSPKTGDFCLFDERQYMLPIVGDDGHLSLAIPPRLQRVPAGTETGTVPGEESPTPPAPPPAPVTGSVRDAAKAAGIHGNRLLGQASRFAREMGLPIPQSVDVIDDADPALVARLAAWVAGEVDPEGPM